MTWRFSLLSFSLSSIYRARLCPSRFCNWKLQSHLPVELRTCHWIFCFLFCLELQQQVCWKPENSKTSIVRPWERTCSMCSTFFCSANNIPQSFRIVFEGIFVWIRHGVETVLWRGWKRILGLWHMYGVLRYRASYAQNTRLFPFLLHHLFEGILALLNNLEPAFPINVKFYN